MTFKLLAPLAAGFGLVLAMGATPGCNCDQSNQNGFHRDLSGVVVDMAVPKMGGDGAASNPDALNACGDEDPSCTVVTQGPTGNPSMPFPLPTDNPPPANVNADGVGRDPTGALILDSTKANFDFLWVADDINYGIGFISKISTKPRTPPAGVTIVNGKYNEVARYVTVTCYSDNTPANWPDRSMTKLGTGFPGSCDGTKGCCDNAPAGGRKLINLHDNRPSRTAVDFNGDVWVSNRGFGLQSSVSKIANKNDSNPAMSDCVDRNGNGKIDTSGDFDGNGIIDTDCNQNNVPDDLIDTDPTKGGTACIGGKAQEFFGLDDECILFTTDTGVTDGWGRPLALGPGSSGDFGPSDAWAGRYQDGTFFRINGKTGYIMTTVVIPDQASPLTPAACASAADCAENGNATAGGPRVPSVQCVANKCTVGSHPYGATIDQFGILWAPNIDGHFLFYFDTNDPNNPNRQGIVAPPATGMPNGFTYGGLGFYGVTLDGYQDSANKLVQQIWMASYGEGGAFRYRPKRTTNFSDLAGGTWAFVTFSGPSYAAANGRGIAADNRTPANVWVGIDSTPGGVGRIDDNVADGASTSTNVYRTDDGAMNHFAGNTTLGVGVANDLDIWGVNQGDNSLTHFTVSATAALTPEYRVELSDNPRIDDGTMRPHPYTYSDFTGFGLRNFTNPRGFYQWTQTGCGSGTAMGTRWLKVIWDADVPANTSVALKVRSADDPTSLTTVPFSAPYTTSPADLQAAPALMPNPSGYLEIEFDLSTMQKDITPRLKSFQILYECVSGVG